MNLPGIPETVPRADVVAFLQGLGIDTEHLRSFTLSVESIEARVLALDEQGRAYSTRLPDGDSEVAEHSIRIRLV